MINKLKNPEFLWNTLAQIIQMIGAIFIIKLLAMYLTKGEYGIYVLLNSILALFMILPFNAISHGITRHVAKYINTSNYKNFFSISFLSQVIIFFLILVISIISVNFIDFELKPYINLLFILALTEIIKTTLRSIENANRKRKKIAISSFFEFTAKIFVIYLCQNFQLISIENILIIIIVGNLLSIIILMTNNYSNIKFNISSESITILVPIILFSTPLIFSQLFGWVRDMSSRWILQSSLDNESVAVFALIATLAAIIPNGIYSLLGSYILPILYQNEEKNKGYTRNMMFYLIPKLFLGTIIIFIPIYYLQEFIIELLADKKYIEYSWMLPYMYLVFSVYIISMVASYDIYVKKQTKILIYPSILSAIIAVVSGVYFINTYDLMGAMISYSLTYLSYSISIFYLVFIKGKSC